jgi:hypothetical protein
MVPSKGTVFNSSPITSVARALTILYIYFLSFGAASLVPIWTMFGTKEAEKSKKLFTAFWVVPALCFFTLIFLKLVNSGYLLLTAAPACIWLGAWTAEWYEQGAWPKALKLAAISAGVAANVSIFLAFPAYCAYRSVHRFEAELSSVTTAMPQVGSPENLLIVSFDNHFLGYRHAGYYLPNYMTVEYPAANLIEGSRIFAMHGKDSFLLTALPTGNFTRFVLFPLPGGEPEYVEYMDKIEKMLPAGDLRNVSLGGHQFVTAPIKDLPILFPQATPALRR